MKRDRPVVRGLIAAGLSWTLLVGAISLGMLVPQQEVLSGFDSNGELDYSAHASSFAPLSLGFIADILGLEESRVAGADGSNEELATAVASDGTTTAYDLAAGPTDVEHPFTNDDVEGAYTVSSLPFRGRTDTGEGTRSSDEPIDCFPSGGTAWYRYVPTADVALFSDTFGTSRATALGVYSRTRSGPLEPIGCDRNALGNAQVGFRAEAGTAYYFQVTSMVRGGPTIFELAAVGATTVESIPSSGAPADASVFDRPDISADGRYVVFTSYARNLTEDPPECANHSRCASVYLRDRVTKQTTVISSTSSPSEDDRQQLTFYPSISPDGRYVGFGTFGTRVIADLQDNPSAPKADSPFYSSYVFDRVTERLRLVSRNSRGEPARSNPLSGKGLYGGSLGPSISVDGRYAVFNSDAENMPGHTPADYFNVYRRDLLTGKTRLVSTTPSGRPNRSANCAATGRNISGDGRYVVYWSTYGGGGGTLVYMWDARTGKSRLVSKRVHPGDKGSSYCPSISLDGSRVALISLDALVPEDNNGTPDAYVYEVKTERIQRISVTPEGKQTFDPNYIGREFGHVGRTVNLSADGRFVVFDSAARDLAPSAVGSTRHPPETTRVFLHDILTGATKLVSVSSTGEPLGGNSRMPYISADGNAVVFLNTGPSGLERVMVHELSLYR